MRKSAYLTLGIFVISFLCLLIQDCFATQWAKTYGGSGDEVAYSIQQTSDGDYIVTGSTSSFGAGSSAMWILKLDSNGNVSWQKTYGGSGFDIAAPIQQTTDGGYIVAGHTRSFGAGSNDMWILKLDSNGGVSWQKTFGESEPDTANSIQQTRDGGYIVAGNTWSFGAGDYDMWILKLDSNGNVSWENTYGGSIRDNVTSIQQTTDEGYIVAVNVESFGAGSNDMWILKLDSNGNVSWQKTFGGSLGEVANSIQQTSDGGYIVAGYTTSFGTGGYDMWILKLDSNGTVSWQKTYGWGNVDRAWSIQQTTDGGYIVAGDTKSSGVGDWEMWILKLDSSGNVTWQKTYGGSGDEVAYSIQQTTDGGYIVAGETYSFGAGSNDMWILKLDSNGDINNCDSIDTSSGTVTDTSVFGVDTSVTGQTTTATVTDTSINPQVSTAEIEEQCFAADWFPAEPPSQDKLNGVWGYVSTGSTHQFYAVGESGTIIHFDGTNWTGTGSPTSDGLNGIWGSSGDDIFAVGENCTIVRYDGSWDDVSPGLFTNDLNDVWGSSASDVYAVGDGGKIAYYNGSSWSEITSPTTDKLTSIWGSSASDYVAVGEGGRIIKYNGTSWSPISSPTSNDLNEVWGSASDNIYAVGTLGTILHFDTSWSKVTSPTSATLRSIWGSSDENIFAVGEQGTILYYDGVSWQKMDSGTQDDLVSTFGTLNPRVMIVGYDGNILSLGGPSVQGKICNSCSGEAIDEVTVEFDKGGNQEQIEQTDPLGIYPTLSSQGGAYPLLFTADGYIQKEITVDLPNNSSIVDHATYMVPSYPDYEDCLSGTVTKTVLIGTIPKENTRGVQNMVVKLYQGITELQSTVTDVGGNYHFTGLSSGTYKVELIITGSECSALPLEYESISVPTDEQYNFELNCPTNPPSTGAYWSEMTSGTDSLLHGIWGSSTTNIFAVGDNGTIIHYDGNWTSQTSGTESNMKGVWGSSASDVYAVGEGGKVLKTTDGGTNWTPMESNTQNGLNAIWGDSGSDIFAVGDSGTIIHYNGVNWTAMINTKIVKLLGVWGNSASDVYAVGNSHKDGYWKRTVLRYDGTDWSEIETGNGVTLMSSWGSGGDDITATGSFGSILRYDGTDWKQIGGPTERTLNAMWGASSSDIFAVGYGGAIAHYDGTGWSVRKTDEPHDLYGIWGNSSTEVFAVGDNGKIFEYKGDLDGDGIADDGDDSGIAGDNRCTGGETENCDDNCPDTPNSDQADSDADGVGNICDNCPTVTNGNQANSDYDEHGNVCDNCPLTTNSGQEDTGDGDGIGDACDNCPGDSNPGQEDNEHDGIGDVCDNCPDDYNQAQEDNDTDDLGDVCDNCPDTPNGQDLGTCVSCTDGSIGSTCIANEQCTNGYCSMDQEDYDGDNIGDVCDADVAEDTYPPGGNGCIDAWECEADFDGDGNVAANDVTTFLNDFGRNQYNQPCSICIIGSGIPPTNFCQADVDCGEGGECGPDPGNPCNGDFDCDGAVASNDVTKFLEDFGRNAYNKPCPIDCQTGAWCSY